MIFPSSSEFQWRDKVCDNHRFAKRSESYDRDCLCGCCVGRRLRHSLSGPSHLMTTLCSNQNLKSMLKLLSSLHRCGKRPAPQDTKGRNKKVSALMRNVEEQSKPAFGHFSWNWVKLSFNWLNSELMFNSIELVLDLQPVPCYLWSFTKPLWSNFFRYLFLFICQYQ